LVQDFFWGFGLVTRCQITKEEISMKLLNVFKWMWYELGIMGTLIDDYGDPDGAQKLRIELYKKQDELK